MSDQLMNSLKSEGGELTVSKTTVPSGNSAKAVGITRDVSKKELYSQILRESLVYLMSLFSKQSGTAGAKLLQSNIPLSEITNLTDKSLLSQVMPKTIASLPITPLINMIAKNNTFLADYKPSFLTDSSGRVDKSASGKVVKNLLRKFLSINIHILKIIYL